MLDIIVVVGASAIIPSNGYFFNTNKMEDNRDIFEYITTEENSWKTARVPITRSKDWNMSEHIERCTAVAGGFFYTGKNDGERPYDDIVTPIINVAMRSEGFDVKDIVPFVNDKDNYHLSFFIKKFHPQWARENNLDEFIDDLVETSVIYDLALIKNVNEARPEVIDLKTLAFCDQTDIMAGPICIKHQYTPAEMVENKGKWIDGEIDKAIALAVEEIEVSIAGNQKVKMPGKYVEVYELRGNLPERWIDKNGEKNIYISQMHLVCYYKDKDDKKQRIVLYKGKDKPLSDNFKALKIDRIRSKGRACGRSVVETLFEPQVWSNYSGIKIKELLDSAINVFVSDSEELSTQKLTGLENNQVIKQEKGSKTQRLDGSLQNLQAFVQHKDKLEDSARVMGSANDPQLGKNPASGTPFALQRLLVSQGQGFHEYRQGKIASFVADVLYRDWILQYIVGEMNGGKEFSEELTLDEMQEVSEKVAKKQTANKMKELKDSGQQITQEMVDETMANAKKSFNEDGNRKFFKLLGGELKKLPVKVFINIKGKQKDMAIMADKLTNILREVMQNPQAFAQNPGIAKVFNELLEASGFSPINFTQITEPQQLTQQPQIEQPKEPIK